MNALEPSLTAMVTALMRAIHTRIDPAPLFVDSWGDRLVPEQVQHGLRDKILAGMDSAAREVALAAPHAVVDRALRASAAYADVIFRTRYTEDVLGAAIERGIRQYVILGAGFDSFALRSPAFTATGSVFEVDHAATQGLKRRRLESCRVQAPASLVFIAADLSTESLESALRRSAFQAHEPAFFSWLGVTMYLSREANLQALRGISAIAAAGSELVFTYFDEKLFGPEPGHETVRQLARGAASLGEPWLSGFNPLQIESLLLESGHLLLENLDGTQLTQRYDRDGLNSLSLSSVARIARTRIAHK